MPCTGLICFQSCCFLVCIVAPADITSHYRGEMEPECLLSSIRTTCVLSNQKGYDLHIFLHLHNGPVNLRPSCSRTDTFCWTGYNTVVIPDGDEVGLMGCKTMWSHIIYMTCNTENVQQWPPTAAVDGCWRSRWSNAGTSLHRTIKPWTRLQILNMLLYISISFVVKWSFIRLQSVEA